MKIIRRDSKNRPIPILERTTFEEHERPTRPYAPSLRVITEARDGGPSMLAIAAELGRRVGA